MHRHKRYHSGKDTRENRGKDRRDDSGWKAWTKGDRHGLNVEDEMI